MLRLTLTLLFLASPVMAWETDCPLVDPENPGRWLVGGEGAESAELLTTIKRRGDIWHATEITEHWGERDKTLTCQYRGPNGGGRDIVLKVPGLMVRCDWLGRDVLKPKPVEPGTGGPIDTVFLRIWCTSRP